MGPQQWLNEQRLLMAMQMLRTATSVKEVGHELGYRRMSQFSRDFRNHFGYLPSELLTSKGTHSPKPVVI